MDQDSEGCWRIGRQCCSIIAEYVAETVEECDALQVSSAHREHVRVFGPWSEDKLRSFCESRLKDILREDWVYTSGTYEPNVYVFRLCTLPATEYPYLYRTLVQPTATVHLLPHSFNEYVYVPSVYKWMSMIKHQRRALPSFQI